MNHKEYNGWTNYETWVVKLWMDNDQGSANFWCEQAREILTRSEPSNHFTSEEQATLTLSDMLKAEHEAAMPELIGFPADLLNAAMSEVNWSEIAEHLIGSAVEAMEAIV